MRQLDEAAVPHDLPHGDRGPPVAVPRAGDTPDLGPIGFEGLIGELDPDRRYEPYLLGFESDNEAYLVDTVADWFTLIDSCGPDTTRTIAARDFTQLP